MSKRRGAYQRQTKPPAEEPRYEPCYTHGYAAGFFQIPRKALFCLVRTGQIPGPVLVNGKVRWPHSLLVWIKSHGVALPGMFENNPDRRPNLADYRRQVDAEVQRDALRMLAAAESATGRTSRRRRKGADS